jgi:hypothetical protein
MRTPNAPGLAALALLAGLLLGCTAIPTREDEPEAAPAPAATPAPTRPPSPNRIEWQGNQWYLHGANMPWHNWRLDFGGANSGVAAVGEKRIAPRLEEASKAGVKVVRWWVFEGDAWQVQRDASGPIGLHDNIWRDFDKAVELAERYDLYYQFVLFSDPRHIPRDWIVDPEQRERLAEVLGPLFARYADNPRVMTWEIFNEPDWAIWNAGFPLEPTQETVRAIAASVKANSPAHVTVGAAMMDGLKHWTNLGLTFYQAHWYDYMSGGHWDALANDYDYQRARYDLDAPLIIGEFYAGADIDALARMTSWYDKGYAGAYAWSLFYEGTYDRMQVDFGATRIAACRFEDLGPGNGVLEPEQCEEEPEASATPRP